MALKWSVLTGKFPDFSILGVRCFGGQRTAFACHFLIPFSPAIRHVLADLLLSGSKVLFSILFKFWSGIYVTARQIFFSTFSYMNLSCVPLWFGVH